MIFLLRLEDAHFFSFFLFFLHFVFPLAISKIRILSPNLYEHPPYYHSPRRQCDPRLRPGAPDPMPWSGYQACLCSLPKWSLSRTSTKTRPPLSSSGRWLITIGMRSVSRARKPSPAAKMLSLLLPNFTAFIQEQRDNWPRRYDGDYCNGSALLPGVPSTMNKLVNTSDKYVRFSRTAERHRASLVHPVHGDRLPWPHVDARRGTAQLASSYAERRVSTLGHEETSSWIATSFLPRWRRPDS